MNEAKSRWSILYFYGSYGLFYVIAILYRNYLPNITFHFWIAELNKQVEFTMQVAELFDLILLGVLFCINSFNSFTILEEFMIDKTKWRRLYFIICVCIINFGVISHMVANQLHEYIYAMEAEGTVIEAGSNLEKLALGLYFWDEIVSHILTGIGFFMLTVLFVVMDRNCIKTDRYDSKLVMFLSFLVGMGIALGLIEGQAGAFFFVVSVIMLGVTLLIMIGAKFAEKPFNRATIYVLLGYIVFILLYIYFTGLKPNYPFIKQMSEL